MTESRRFGLLFGGGLLALSAVVSIASCDSAKITGCQTDMDCTGNNICTADNQCQAPVKRPLGLEVIPPHGNNARWVVQEFLRPTIDSRGRTTLRLTQLVSVQGRVYASHHESQPVPAHITVWRQSLLPGRPPVQTSVTTGGKFAIWLEPGHEYSFLVRPKPPYDELYPPRLEQQRVDRHMRHDLVLDGDDRAIRVIGRVVDAVGHPLPRSVRVSAFKPGTWIRSTVGVTCSSNSPHYCPYGEPKREFLGQFTIRLPFGVDTYTVRVESIPYSSGDEHPLVVPTLECTGKVLGLVPADGGHPRPVEIELPSFLYVHKSAILTVVGGPDFERIRGVRLELSTLFHVGDPIKGSGFKKCSASYRALGVTNADGKTSLPLLGEREYLIAATPPSDSRYASRSITREVAGHGGVLGVIELVHRNRLAGRVLDPDGEGLSNTTIEARRIDTNAQNPDADDIPPGEGKTTTDRDGRFVLYVNSGTYDLHITPRPDAGLPMFSLKRLVFGADEPEPDLEIPAPRPEVLEGRLLDADGRPAAGVAVNTYHDQNAQKLSTDSTAALRATAVTDSAGRFRLLLAPAQD